MIIGGLQKFSLLDYPDHLSAIIFTQGCNFQCQFCYNPMLVVVPQKDHHPKIKEDDLFAFLKKRAGKLDAIVITGGEPTIHADLPEFIAKIKKLGYLVKLDTNGANPKMIKYLTPRPPLLNRRGGDELPSYLGGVACLPVRAGGRRQGGGINRREGEVIDYIAMDIKAPKNKYEKIVGVPVDFNKIKKSVKIIMESGLPYEFRTTVVPGLLTKDDIIKIAKIIKGADKWYLQQFKSNIDLVNKRLGKVKPYSAGELEEMCEAGRKYVKKCEVR